ncbi:MAG: aldehyde:ferredoxin oxidoreductase [Planctomycetes bacterium]|nr:aldehyde:ferredoxin oxidoreductase [Planctomycetota bacterium]
MAAEAGAGRRIGDFRIRRFHADLGRGEARAETIPCADLEDLLGGVARGMKVLAARHAPDPLDPAATLVLNLGVLSGTGFMTGLRTFLHAWSPLKASRSGAPGPMWSAGSGEFGTWLAALGVEEILLTGRAASPTVLRISPGPEFRFLDGSDLAGLTVNGKIRELHRRFPGAHFAAVGPAGEHGEAVRYASVALSTGNQLRSGDPKPRFCGRGGMGTVMGSKNLLAVVVDGAPGATRGSPPSFRELNREAALGPGSRRFRDAGRAGGGGGTWANFDALGPLRALPGPNFSPMGVDRSLPLHRSEVEKGPFAVIDESCLRCGIRCHKNVYDRAPSGGPGGFRAKLDYEPLALLGPNLGILDPGTACDLVRLVDEAGLDAISLGATLSFAMEHNRRRPDAPVAGGLSFGDAAGAAAAVAEIAAGRLPLLGQGAMRLAAGLGETGFAMQCKGLELPAYLPQTNPGYPFALAGGHMSMRTYLLLLHERETGLDYWVDAITRRGPMILRDDLLGVCKFAGLDDARMAAAVSDQTGLPVDAEALRRAVMRTHLRGYALERAHGFGPEDYDMPAEVHRERPELGLPHFNTAAFFAALKERVLRRFDAMVEEEGIRV